MRWRNHKLGPALRGAALSLACLTVFAPACSSTKIGELAAVDGTRRLMVSDRGSGLSVVLTTDAWDGVPPYLDEELTVVHMLVANMGARPIRLAPGDFTMTDERGFHYSLFDAGGSFRLAGPDERGGTQPEGVRHTSYHPGVSDRYELIEAPGTDVAASALPWGVLQPGTQMRGFLYFEALDTANHATLVWHVHDGQSQPVVDIGFDLYVFR